MLTFTFRGSRLPQPQGWEQVDPPPRHLPSDIREEQAGVSRALQGHLLQQRGQVPPTTPRISSYRCPPGFLVSAVPLTLTWFWTPQHSLWQRSLSVLGVAFYPPGKPKLTYLQNPGTFSEKKKHVYSDSLYKTTWQADFYSYSCLNMLLKLQKMCYNLYKHYDSRVGAARWIGHIKCPPESIGYELEGWGRWGRALALRWFPFLARVCLRFICSGLCVYLIRHERTGKMQVNIMWN